MTEPTPPTELSALEDLIAAFDSDQILELLQAVDLVSQHPDTRNRLIRLMTVINIDFPALVQRRDALIEPEAEPEPEA